jgi:hypothetical protein
MKVYLLAAAAALALAACGPATPPASDAAATPETAAADPAPAPAAANPAIVGPAAGQWEVTLTASGMTIPPQKVCYAKQLSFAEAQEMQAQAGMTCSENNYSPSADGVTGHSHCTMQGMSVTTDTRITGDFNTAYTMEMTSTMDPAPAGVPQPATTTIKMVRLGDCPAAQ